MLRQIMAVVAAFGLLAQDAAFARQASPAAPNQVPITWGELGSFVADQRISTVLPDGAKLEGEVLAVRPESLVLDVQKSSRRKLYPLGQTEIPRASITEVLVIREQSAVMRVFGAILGGIGGAFGVSGLGYLTESLAVVLPALILGIPLAAAAGYCAGKLADRHTTRLKIRPAMPAGPIQED